MPPWKSSLLYGRTNQACSPIDKGSLSAFLFCVCECLLGTVLCVEVRKSLFVKPEMMNYSLIVDSLTH